MPYKNLELKRANMQLRNLRKRGATKKCIICLEEKPEEEFIKKHDRIRQKNRRSSYCHPCRKIRMQEYRRKSVYGIGKEEYRNLFNMQNGKCAICQIIFNDTWRVCVDHSHLTNKIRALLCVRCNVILGQVEEDVNILEQAIKYLNQHK